MKIKISLTDPTKEPELEECWVFEIDLVGFGCYTGSDGAESHGKIYRVLDLGRQSGE